MRVLLDECLPRGLANAFESHTVQTVPEAGWAGKSNGELLKLAEGSFDAFVTIDRGIQYQQNLKSNTLAILALAAPTNRLEDLLPLMPKVLEVLEDAQPGQYIQVAAV